MPGLNSRASSGNVASELSAEVQLFKDTYVQERQVLDRFRQGEFAAAYQPASSLDGKSKYPSQSLIAFLTLSRSNSSLYI